MKTGLVSVTFRRLTRQDIVKLCEKAGLEMIEWGGDVHVPAGDIFAAAEAAVLCERAGIVPQGYGSYYNAADDPELFRPSLVSAKMLGAKYIRIWAGRGLEYSETAEKNIAAAVEASARDGIKISLECHRGTMTENADIGVKLAKNTGCMLHFQPNPDIDFNADLDVLKRYSPYLCAVHVFAWEQALRGGVKTEERLPLKARKEQWLRYASEAPDVPFLLEFVRNDSADSFFEDAEALLDIAGAR
ncbi:MAG: sugar phosphate isomerase/epimerase [Clostridia bacterium]|nr:sugar phosphate isomerase/epimerase [Clostridia bacterium]